MFFAESEGVAALSHLVLVIKSGDAIMKILFWLGVLLFGQAFAYLPYLALFERNVFYLSIGLGVIGLLTQLVQTQLLHGTRVDRVDDGIGSEASGGVVGEFG